MASKPKVYTECVADAFSGPAEKIAEFNVLGHPELGGGLIALRVVDGVLHIGLKQVDQRVVVEPVQRKDT
jgi:hypothetical protein